MNTNTAKRVEVEAFQKTLALLQMFSERYLAIKNYRIAQNVP